LKPATDGVLDSGQLVRRQLPEQARRAGDWDGDKGLRIKCSMLEKANYTTASNCVSRAMSHVEPA
jgi:hypothetical protein